MSWQHWMKDHRTIGTTDFMPDVSLPPWLSVNPAQSAEVFLHAYGAGAGAGASARAASQRDEELAFHEQQAQQLDAIRQQEQQLATEKFGLDLREKQRAAEREAQEAAMQLEGQQQLSKALAQGTPIHEALAAAGPKLFYRHPEKMFQALHQVTPPPLAPAPQWVPPDTATGAPGYMRNLKTGQPSYPPVTPATGPLVAEDILDASGQPTGVRAYRGAHGAVHPLKPEGLSQEGQIRAISAGLRSLDSQWFGATPEEKKAIKVKRAALMDKLESFTNPKATTVGPPTPGTIKNGFRFKGGDPAVKENWEKVAAGKIDESTPPDENSDEEEE